MASIRRLKGALNYFIAAQDAGSPNGGIRCQVLVVSRHRGQTAFEIMKIWPLASMASESGP